MYSFTSELHSEIRIPVSPPSLAIAPFRSGGKRLSCSFLRQSGQYKIKDAGNFLPASFLCEIGAPVRGLLVTP